MKYIIIIITFCGIHINLLSQTTTTLETNTSFLNYYPYSNKITHHFNVGNAVSIIIKNLGKVGLNVDVQVKNVRSKTLVHTYSNKTILPNFGGAIQIIDNSPTWGQGMFYIEIHFIGSSPPPMVDFPNQIIVLETTQNFNHGGMDFIIHYTNEAFDNHPLGNAHMPTYIANLETIIKDVWDTEVTTWDLCNGLAAIPSGSAANTPSDKDNTYHFVIHNLSEIVVGLQNDFFYSKGNDNDRVISIDSRATTVLNGLAHTAQFEKELLYSIVAHEFYHGIQWSHMLSSNFSSVSGELDKRLWIVEGQARFLETVFMSDATYNTTSTNAAYIINSLDYNYADDVSRFINYIYDDGTLPPKPVKEGTRAYLYPSLHKASYEYAIFWRHLFEHHFPTGATIQTKMALLRQTMISQNTINNSVFANIESDIFDNNLSAVAGGNFKTYDEALIDFTEKLYFHDQAYNTAVNRAVLFQGITPTPTEIWYDPNPTPNDNFYSRITSFNEPVESLNIAGTSFTKVYDIPSSFGHRAHRFKFSRNAEIKIEFESNPGSRPGFGDFNVDCYLLNGVTIEQKQNIALNSTLGTGDITLNVDEPGKQIVVLVTRLDANEGTANDYPDYRLSLSEVSGTAGTKYMWPVPKKLTSNELFFGGQHTIIGQFGDFRNNGSNVFCKGIEIEASTIADERNVYALEDGIAYVEAGVKAVNIGHFRYAHLNNLTVTNGTPIKAGDKIGDKEQTFANISITETGITNLDVKLLKDNMANNTDIDFTFEYNSYIPNTPPEFRFTGIIDQARINDVDRWEWKFSSGSTPQDKQVVSNSFCRSRNSSYNTFKAKFYAWFNIIRKQYVFIHQFIIYAMILIYYLGVFIK